MENLLIVQYGPGKDSLSKYLGIEIRNKVKNFEVDYLDLAKNIPDVFDEEKMDVYVRRNFKQEEVSEEDHSKLKKMDEMADQYLKADYIVLVTPMYNFGVPAIVKGWMDSIAQAKKTFKYSEYGPVGLGKVKKIYIAVVSNSTPKDSARDYMSGHLKTYFQFLGIKEVEIDGVYASRFLEEEKTAKADEVIEKISKELNNLT